MKLNKKKVGAVLSIIILILFFMMYINHVQELKNRPMPQNLHPVVKENRDKLIKQAEESGISILVYDGFRTVEEQNELYEKGRTSAGSIVTYSEGGESYHNYGLAIDFAIELDDGSVIWDTEYDGNGNGQSDWMEVVDIAKNLGFEWGGDWENFRDYPHLQIDFGLSIRELQRGERPDIPYHDEPNNP